MKLNAGTSPLIGGTLTLDGIPIIVPNNTIATLPAAAVSWPELFLASGAPNLPGYPGSMWKATVSFLLPYILCLVRIGADSFGKVFGNRVNDQYIAGLVYLAQDPFRVLQGFVTSIDLTTGHFTVAGKFSSPAGYIQCVLNDPLGVYGRSYTANPLWSVDPVNPSVHATTGCKSHINPVTTYSRSVMANS